MNRTANEQLERMKSESRLSDKIQQVEDESKLRNDKQDDILIAILKILKRDHTDIQTSTEIEAIIDTMRRS